MGQTFVYQDNTLGVNNLRAHRRRLGRLENPSESLVESGLSHPAGKTFRAGQDDGSCEGGDYVCDQSAARARAGGMDRNSTPTR
jgi:hypothetical protein